MQATTSETYVVGTVLEAAVRGALGRTLSAKEIGRIGFEGSWDIAGALKDFRRVLDSVKDAVPALVPFTDAEAATYAAGRFRPTSPGKPSSRYSPTPPSEARRSAFSLWTRSGSRRGSAGSRSGRRRRTRGRLAGFLGRPFRGLDPEFYREPFENEIEDPYLRTAALESLKKAGNDQADLYDFSFPWPI